MITKPLKRNGWIVWDNTKKERAIFKREITPYFEYYAQADKYIYNSMANSKRYKPKQVNANLVPIPKELKRRYVYDTTYNEVNNFGIANDIRRPEGGNSFPLFLEEYIKHLKEKRNKV